MMHFIKIHAKPIVKAIAQLSNVAAVAGLGLQASGALSALDPKLTAGLTFAIILLNMLAHTLKPYIAADTPVGTVALPTVVVPAPGAVAAAAVATLPPAVTPGA